MTENLIKVSIAKLGSGIQTVEIAEWSTVMVALRKAGYNLDSVVSTKRNWVQVAMDTLLSDSDVLLVSQEKIKWGAKEEEEEEVEDVIILWFSIEKEWQPAQNKMVFSSSESTFNIIKSVLIDRGYSMNDFKEILDKEGNKVTLWEQLQNDKDYRIVVCQHPNCDETYE